MNTALHTLLAHAERQRDKALASLLRADEAAQHMCAQTQQLLAYRDEYHQRSPTHGGRVASIELLRCHQSFMHRLELALTQQHSHQQAAERAAIRLRQALVAQELRVASVRKLLERRVQEQQRAEARLDQRRSDEAAQQRLWRNAAETVSAGY